MDALTDLLQSQLFSIADQPVSVVEAIGFLTGALCVWAVARGSILNWPLGIVNNLAFLLLFAGVGLYADAALQIAFGVLGVYGWVQWSKRRRGWTGVAGGSGEAGVVAAASALPIRRATGRELLIGGAIALVATVAVGYLLAAETNSQVPWPDAFILAFSLLATWGQAKKLLEQWWIWIAVDLVSIPLYLVKGLWLTALLYTGFLALCVYGLTRWTREYRAAAGAAAGRVAERIETNEPRTEGESPADAAATATQTDAAATAEARA
ncbi:nicotinamide riboside transporter PnuC [Agromyces sp. Leaf222]|uniref:nicotinamide riboside transporter PnuC n=1 Tax=Agromyces sp. Leaf222 TaxID=1735688 RepID=UPI0009EAED51|nr:nicotinamide riboside transporter PnuC [Agromyces sp. Leaf222]